MKKKNNYTPTDVNYHGGLKYGANIHSVTVQVNQYVWNMMKVLEKHELYGFDFESKIGTRKTIVTLSHEDKELLKEAKEILKYSHEDVDFLFLTKVKKKKNDKTVWVILIISLIFLVISLIIYYLYDNREVLFSSSSIEESSKSTSISNKPPVIQDIEIDMEKLNAFKESFSKEDGKPVDDKVMKVLEITTSVVSSMVSEEEKEKYSSKNLVESFKGKGGIRFVAKDGNLSKDLNATVKELNDYADEFIRDGNNRLALQAFDKALEVDMKESNQDDIAKTLAKQAELYENLGDKNNSIASYNKLLKVSKELSKDDFLKYTLTQATIKSKLIELYGAIGDEKFNSKEAIVEAEKLYKIVIEELKKSSKSNSVKQSHLALALNYLSNFYEQTKKDYLLSIEIRKKALEIYKKLSKSKSKKFTLSYYKTLNSLGHSYLILKKIPLADKIYTDGLSLAQKKLKNSKYIALSLRALAMVEIEREEFKTAKKYYYDALKIYKNRFKKGSKEFIEIDECFAYLEQKRGDVKLAKRLYKKVIRSYKSLNKKEPLVYNLDIAKALTRLANLYLKDSENRVEAEMKLFEAISLIKKVKGIYRKEANIILADTYRSLAYLSTLENNMKSAWSYYKKANRLK